MNLKFSNTQNLHMRSTVIDMHVHPSLKTYLFSMNMKKRYKTAGGWNPFTLRVDLQKLMEGGVNAILSTVYVPEKMMINDCWFLKLMYFFAKSRLRKMIEDNPFDVAMRIIDHFEDEVERVHIQGRQIAQVAHSKLELSDILRGGRIAVLHSIEGGHARAGKIENVEKFFDRGVCLLTLAHFYENAIGPTVGGIPDSKKFFSTFKHEGPQKGRLTEFGRVVIKEMIRLGMLIDMTHCNPETRTEVLGLNNNVRPIICTHVGLQRFHPHPHNLTDIEIKRIAETGGVIGTIFMNYWLVGQDGNNGLDYIVETMKHLRKVGGIECVALGSDFDGVTDPPDDIKDPSEFPKLTRALIKAGFTKTEVEKVLGKNVLRVLDDGWGNSYERSIAVNGPVYQSKATVGNNAVVYE